MTTTTTTYSIETQRQLDEIWERWKAQREPEPDLNYDLNFCLIPDPYFVRPSQGAYKLHYPNQQCPDFDVLANLKAVGKEKRIIWKVDLQHWIDVFGWLIGDLGWDWDRGVDLGIFMAYRVGGWTRKDLCAELQEEDAVVQNSIKKSERFIRKHIDQIRWHYFDFISAIENCGVSYSSAIRPRFVWVPADMLIRF
jgi:hypothetical protein